MKDKTQWHPFLALRPRVLTSGKDKGAWATGRIARRWHPRSETWRYARIECVWPRGRPE